MIKLPPGINELVIPAPLMGSGRYSKLTYSAVFLYAVLHALPKETGEGGEKFVEISAAEIQEIVGCKDSSFRANLGALKRAGLVECRKPRFGSVNRYIVREAA